ncbi:PRC-barrel domain-containing protein [Desulfallas sp. Bu1-1]|jgi:uncharacterized protein YrrD|uniref:PRC-barrel domain-containing protein n=1 Tax=Desulfallas sp. Bu1-1 TaxID=2787620 RepID=UPI00189DDEDF|nr:PRC-barrel domain-containing protein [Desulfallas sp. Bu1-1]MBF7082681.1 PRC-barrel domain-containing protein [Desulfallas sp. Bu1-1]
MRKSKQFASMPVISLEEGKQVGTIKGLVINPGEKRVAALIVEQKGLFNDQKFVTYSKIRSVGEDAVTIHRGAFVQKGDNLPEIISLVKDKCKINGARIVTESGTLLGIVDDYYVDLTSGELVGMEFSGGYISGIFSGTAFLDIEHVLTIGKEMIVCSDEAVEKAVKLDGGLQDKLRSVKESTGQLWESTIQKSRELGSNVNKSFSRFKRNKPEDMDDQTTGTSTGDIKPEDTTTGEKPPKEE